MFPIKYHNSNYLAPQGCTQYFFGEDNGKFYTFNYDGGNHLANQNQNICFRYDQFIACYSEKYERLKS